MRKILIGGLVSLALLANAQTPVQKYGQLKVTGSKITDAAGNAVQLRGMSTFWSNSNEGDDFFNANTVNWLRDDWCTDVIRVAMGVEQLGGINGYLNNASGEYNKVKTVIDACIAKGIYVIVDFHSHNAEQSNQKAAAKTFFQQIAQAYGDKPNVMYETFNEPINQSWSTLKAYHNEMVAHIRQYDADNIIICGTRSYSREVAEASLDKVSGSNIAYTMHFYAGGGADHNADLKGKVLTAMSNGAAIVCTEYGTCDPSGNGSYNAGNTQSWWDFMDQNKISHCNWSVCNKGETASILTPGTSALNNWTTSQLTTSGNLVRNHLKARCNTSTGSVTITVPANNASFAVGASVTITATATVSAGGTVGKIEFYDGTNLIGSKSTPAAFSIATTTLSPGTHQVTAKAYDNTGVLLATSPITTVLITSTSNITTTGISDFVETTTQTSKTTGGVLGASCASATTAAAAGIYWFDDKDAATPFKAEYTRAGGKINYTISQAAASYSIIGFNFGEYCNGTTKTKYSLDLSGNAVVKMTVEVPATNTVELELKFQMKDADGTSITINKTALPLLGTANDKDWYKHEIGFSKNHVAPDFVKLPKALAKSVNFEFDFKNTLSIKNPLDPKFPVDINTNNTDFDFTKVVEIVLLPLNAEDVGSPSYAPKAFTDQKISFSNIVIGDPTKGVDICTTPKAVTVKDTTYCQNATAKELTAKGITGLNLQWYETATLGTGSLEAPTPSTSSTGVKTYYVSQKVGTGTCEGPRTAININVVAGPTSDAGAAQPTAVGPTINLAGTGSAVGTWSFVSGPSAATSVTVTPATSANAKASGLTVQGDYLFRYTVPGTTTCPAESSDLNVTVTSITSISDEFLNSNVEMYPNPVSDILYINMDKVEGAKSLKLVDMFGKTMFESSNTENITVPMNNFNAGMYIIQVQTASGVLTKTIVKK